MSAGYKDTLDDLLGKMNLHDNPIATDTDTAAVGTGASISCGCCDICYGGRGRGSPWGEGLPSN